MARARARCTALGCTNFAVPDTGRCAAHKRRDEPYSDLAARTRLEDAQRRQRASDAFRAKVQQGEYRALFGGKLGRVIEQAAAEESVGDELGALRYVMAKLLAEEDDPVVLAKNVSRVAAVSIQGARVQRIISGQMAEGLTDAITTILEELDRGE